jgi:hypothetical protein
MRWLIPLLLLLVLATTPLLGAARDTQSQLTGTVLDLTCPGPCQVNGDPRPFLGEAVVVVRRQGESRPVVTVPVKDSHFTVALRPGRYQVRVVPFPEQQPSCWEGSTRRVRLLSGQVTDIELTVLNRCIV